MSKNLNKFLSLFLSFCLILEQSVFAQTIDLSHYFARGSNQTIPQSDKFRPLHLRYLSYDNQANDFKLLLDKGDFFNQKMGKPKNEKTPELEKTTQELMKYFFIGLALPNDKFWVNLRPDSPDNILDPDLEKTDIGRIFLEADVNLKQDTAGLTSPQTPEGKQYWDKLYKKAGELFGSENISIPTLTRPWIVPDEVILRESPEGAYIYKATLKVMLEEDYLRGTKDDPAGVSGRGTIASYSFNDPRLKELNEYSTQLIKESIVPRLTREINSARRYAPLRQVYYSLILAQWFKQKSRAPGTSAPVNSCINLIDSGNLVNLASSQPYDKQSYFQQYRKSFKDGEYNLQEQIHTPMGQSIRRYMSGGMQMDCSSVIDGGKIIGAGSPVFGNLTRIKKYAIYLSVSLPLTIFSAEPSIKAVTIRKNFDDNGPKVEAIVEREKSLEEVVRAVCRKLFVDIKEEEVVEYIAIIKKQYSNKKVGRDGVIDVTKLLEKNTVRDILTKCEVVSEKIIEVKGQKHKMYFIKSGDNIKALNSTPGGTIGNVIFINLKVLERNVKFLMENKEVNFIPPMITEDELHQDMLEATVMHELMHILLSRLLREGLKTPHLDSVLMDWFGNVPPEEFLGMKQELIAHLVQTLSSSLPKSYLLDFMASLSEEDKPRHYINIFTVIINEVFMAETDDDFEKGLRNLSNEQIKKRVKMILEKYYGKDVLLTISMLQEEVKRLLLKERIPRKLEQGNSVKLSINPALLPKINNPDFRKEFQELNIKTIAELVERLGLTTEFLGGSIVVRLQPETGPGRAFYKTIPQQKEEQYIPNGCTVNINPVGKPAGGSSPVRSSPDSPVKKKIMEYIEQAEERLKKEGGYDDTLGMIDLEAMKKELERCVSVEDISAVLHLYGDSDILNERFNCVIDAMVESGVVTIDRRMVFLVDEFSPLSSIFSFVPAHTRGMYVLLNENNRREGIVLLRADETTKYIDIVTALTHEDLHASEGMGGDNGLHRYISEGFVTHRTIAKLSELFANKKSEIENLLYSEMPFTEKMLLEAFDLSPQERWWRYFIKLHVPYKLELEFVAKLISVYGERFMKEVYNTGDINRVRDKFGEKYDALLYFADKSAEARDKNYLEAFALLNKFIRIESFRQMGRVVDEGFSANDLKGLTESFSRTVEMLREMLEEGFKKYFPYPEEHREYLIALKECLDELYNRDIFGKDARLKVNEEFADIFQKLKSVGNKHNNISNSPVANEDTKGGIDLSRINKTMRTESVSSSAFSGGNSPVDVDFNVNEELIQLQKLLNAQIVPSADRLNRYARAARASFVSSPESADSVISLVAERPSACRRIRPSPPPRSSRPWPPGWNRGDELMQKSLDTSKNICNLELCIPDRLA